MYAKRIATCIKQAIIVNAVCTVALLTAPTQAQTLIALEAENASYTGGATPENEHTGFTGTAYLGGFTDANKGNAAVSFTVNVGQSDTFLLDTHYANGTGSAKSLSLYIDNQYIQQLTFVNGSSWADWRTAQHALSLSAGSHSVSLRFDNQDSGNINIDNVSVSSQSTGGSSTALTPGSQLQLEDANYSGGAVVESNHSGYTGSGFLGGFTDNNQGTALVNFTANVTQTDNYTLELRYANGTGTDKTLSVINGSATTPITLPVTSGWASWNSVAVTLQLASGNNDLGVFFSNTDSGNVNLDAVSLSVADGSSPNPNPDPDPDPNPTPEPGAPGSYDITVLGYSGGVVVETEHAGYTGNGYLGGFTDANQGSAELAIPLNITQEGTYRISVRYANGTPTTQTLTFSGDNLASRQLNFASTGGWSAWGEIQFNDVLEVGEQTLYLSFTQADSGNINIDAVSVEFVSTVPDEPTDPVDPPVVPPVGGDLNQTENAFFVGGAYVTTSYAGYQGNGAVVQAANTLSRVITTVNSAQSGPQTVTFRYYNDSSSPAVTQLNVNGLDAGSLTFNNGAGWQQAAFTLPLSRGLNTLALTQPDNGAVAYALDSITLENGADMQARGATMPYTAYEAEQGVTNATVLAPSRTFHEVAAEASGRQAVRLQNSGDFVEFTITEAFNAFVLRSSIPDTADGTGEAHNIGIYVNGTKLADHEVSSYFSWVYGSYPYGNYPSQGDPQRFFDESRMLLGQTLPAGTILRIEKDAGSGAAYYDIDLVETEMVEAPLTKPAGFLSIEDYGAIANDGNDDLNAIRAAISAAQQQGTGVWLPVGEYQVSDRFNLANVTFTGAGPWYSSIAGLNGKGGFYATGNNVIITNLMVDGDVRCRDDSAFHAAIEGNFGTGSLLQNIWVEHTKVGLWTSAGTDGLLTVGLRIRNTFADGVNLHTDIKDTHITQSAIRNTGDDALAMWSSGSPVTRSAFINNTVQVPLLGNGAGIYGGTDNAVLNNYFADTLTGSAGVAVGTRFNPIPLAGTTRIENTTLLRTGGYEPNWQAELGAIWVYADTANITAPVVFNNLDIIDSTHQAILVSWQKQVENLEFKNIYIDGVQANGSGAGYTMEFQAQGNAYFENVIINNAANGNNVWPNFSLILGSGNQGL